jgi:alcohol dehydrogenase class IV
MAGIAFTNASLGINHSLAHAIGAAFHLPHGRSIGVMMPHVIEFNGAAKYAQLARLLGLQAETSMLVKAVKVLIGELGMPLSLQEAGVSAEALSEKLEELAEAAMKDACTATNPRKVTEATLQKLLVEAF